MYKNLTKSEKRSRRRFLRHSLRLLGGTQAVFLFGKKEIRTATKVGWRTPRNTAGAAFLLYLYQHITRDHEILEVFRDKKSLNFQNDISRLEKCVSNKKDGVSDKCAQLIYTCNLERKILNNQPLRTLTTIPVLSVFVSSNLSCFGYTKKRLCKFKTNKNCLRRNVTYRVKIFVKLALYKSIILPIVSFGLICSNLTRGSNRSLEIFQKKSRKCVLWHSRQRSKVQQTAMALKYRSASTRSAN